MNYDALQAFGVFAEELNFTHAARLLHISQPALHVAYKSSRELGLTLYRKEGRNLYLTKDGTTVASFAYNLASRTAAFHAELKGDPTLPIIFAAGRGAHLYLLGDAVKRFLKTCGPLELLPASSADALDAVRVGAPT